MAPRCVAARAPGEQVAFLELSRRRGDFALAGVAFAASLDDGVLGELQIALLGVADRPVLAHEVMSRLAGARLDALAAIDLADAVESDTDPLDDPAYPVAYRRQVVKVLLERALNSLAEVA